MTKISNNPLLKGASGMFADMIVYRESHGQLLMCNRPKKRGAPTLQQVAAKEKFLCGVLYAKGQMADPVARAEYEKMKTKKFVSAYSVAMADYLKSPEVKEVDLGLYTGDAGTTIAIKAFDICKVVTVEVELWDAADVLIEQGTAVQDAVNVLQWIYTATAVNSSLPGTKVIVRAKDKPGNITVSETIL